MELALGIVTIIALIMTVAMGIVTWRLVHEERRRGAARLAALEAELKRRGAPASATSTASDRSSQPPARAIVDVEIPRGADAPGTESSLFGMASMSSGSWSRRFVGIGVAAVLIAAAIGVVVVRTPDTTVETETSQPPAPQVELLSLEHERQGSFVAISGSVRTPDELRAGSALAAMAMVYDDDGVVVASGRVPLEPPSEAGEASFSISLPADDASRYQISFFSDDVTIPHVDRRPGHEEQLDAETTTARHDQ